MSATQADLIIELNVSCPSCGEYVNLLDPALGLNDEGQILEQACPSEGHWSDSHANFEQEVKCPMCNHEFLVNEIEW